MHFNASLLILAVLAVFSMAAPVESSKALQKRHFKVPVKSAPKLDGKREMARAYRKYGWEIIIVDPEQSYEGYGPQSSSAPASSAPPSSGTPQGSTLTPSPSPAPSPSPTQGGEDGEVTATPEENQSEYLSPVSIGGQTLNLNLDTGSADLWVFSTKLSKNEASGHSVFDPTKSSTWKDYSGGSWSITYGDGSMASGSVGFDTVDIGGATVQGQCVELADFLSSKLLSDPASDGIVGLGFSNVNTVEPKAQKTFFANVMDNLDEPLFTADLAVGLSEYEFGKIDTSKYSGDIHYTDINPSNGYWQFDLASYSVDGKQKSCSGCSPSIADTGTSLVLMDNAVVEDYYAKVPSAKFDSSQGAFTVPCDAKLPDFGVGISSDYTATIKGQDMIYAPIPDEPQFCYGGLQPSGGGIQVLGDVLLKRFFAVFDGGNTRFGLAEKN